MYQNTIITIYKYPVINNRCKLYNLTPLTYKHDEVQLDAQFAKCEGNFIQISKCKNNLGLNICKQESPDNCTIPWLENKKA